MKTYVLGIALALTLVGAAVAANGHVKAPLEPVGGSDVSGFVQLTGLPHGARSHRTPDYSTALFACATVG